MDKVRGTKFFNSFKNRGLALVCDDYSSDNRGILVAPAQDISYQIVNEMIGTSGGLLFVSVSPSRSQSLGLEKVRPRENIAATNSLDGLCISVEARTGVSTGISVADRMATIQILGERVPDSKKLVNPGHIFPIEVNQGGVLVKPALPEAAIDIVKIAGFSDAACYIDILDRSGNFLALKEQQALSTEREIPVIYLSELVRFRLETEHLVNRVAQAKLPTQYGTEFTSYMYKSSIYEGEHIAIIKGQITPDVTVLTRVQPEFTFADVFGGDTPPTRRVIQSSLKAIASSAHGVFVYLRRPNSGQLGAQVQSWKEKYFEKPAAGMREYGVGAQILYDIGVRKIELLTNSKKRLIGITSFGIEIVSTRSMPETLS